MKYRVVAAAIALLSYSAMAGSIEFVPLQQRAQGHSLAGASLLNDSLFSNPASAAFTNVYSVDGTVLSPQTFSVSVLDTRTSGMGGALGYYRIARPGVAQAIQVGKLGVTGKVGQNFGFGVAGKAAWGPDLAGTSAHYNDVDLGISFKFDRLQLGMNVNNVFGGSAAMGEGREYSTGGRVNWEDTMYLSVAVSGDVDTLNLTQVGVGAEYVSPHFFALKGGFRTRPIDQRSYWGGGFSILSPRVSLHYAVEIENRSGGTTEHSVGSTFLF